jgi:hypothetical protein
LSAYFLSYVVVVLTSLFPGANFVIDLREEAHDELHNLKSQEWQLSLHAVIGILAIVGNRGECL